MEGDIPPRVAQLKVKECIPELDCRLVFSALDSNVAGPVEEEFAQAGYVVSSNSRNHRMDPDVPLLIPEVNADASRYHPPTEGSLGLRRLYHHQSQLLCHRLGYGSCAAL